LDRLDLDFYRDVLHGSDQGFIAFVPVEGGDPGFKIVDCNKAMGAFLAADPEQLVDKILARSSVVEEDLSDWLFGLFLKAASGLQPSEEDRWVPDLGRYLHIRWRQSSKGVYLYFFRELSGDADRRHIVEKLLPEGQLLIASPDGIEEYQPFTNAILEASGASFAIFNLFEEDGEHFRSVACSGMPRQISKVASMLGFELRDKRWSPDPHRAELIKDHIINRFDSLETLAGSVIPGSVCKIIQKTFFITEIAVVKIMYGQHCFGDFTLVFSRGRKLMHDDLVLLWANQVGMYLERRRQEKEKNALWAVINNSDNIVVVKDLDMRVRATNQTFTNVTPWDSIEELIGKTDAEIFEVDPNSEPVRSYMEDDRNAQKLAPGEFLVREEPVITSTGETRYYLTKKYPIFDQEGVLQGTGNISTDITKLKWYQENLQAALDQAESASLAKSEFLANMSHEIRTPLNGVIGFTDLLLESSLDETQKEFARNASVAAHSLLEIISDILDFSKIEAGKMELDEVRTDLVELVEQAVDIVRYSASAKGLEFLLDMDPRLPRYVWLDPVRVRQVLVNLLSNAVKFTEKGDIEFSVAYYPDEASGKGMFAFWVRDTGIGISEEEQLKIFESFSQADNSMTRRYGGTGLGLVISRRLVEKMGGQLTVFSEKGKGSTFGFSFAKDYEEKPYSVSNSFQAVETALVVDDNAHSRQILYQTLSNLGISCTLAHSPTEAMELYGEHGPFGILITDYLMPQMNGVEMIRMMRKRYSKWMDDQIIMLVHSTSDDRRVLEECREQNIHYHFSKPVKITELVHILERLESPESLAQDQALSKQHVITGSMLQVSRLRILVAEDVALNMKLVTTLLENLLNSPVIISAVNGQEALRKWKQRKPDLILMDVQMPEMDGYTATQKIREEERENGGHVPIIALTAGAFREDEERSLQAGMDAYLSKPLDPNRLAETIAKLVQVEIQEGRLKERNDPERIHFDEDELLRRLGGKEEKLAELKDGFADYLQEELDKLEDILPQQNPEKNRRLAHQIKGGALSMCCDGLAAMAQEVENHPELSKREAQYWLDLMREEIQLLKTLFS